MNRQDLHRFRLWSVDVHRYMNIAMHHFAMNCDGEFCIIKPRARDRIKNYHLKPEMCTARHDEHHRLIYEADILKTPMGNGVVYWDNDSFCFQALLWIGRVGNTMTHFFHDGQFEIIGNVHDWDAREKLDPSVYGMIEFYGGSVCPE